MIYVTGDTHRRHDIAKLDPLAWPAGQTLTRSDYLVVLGDFGAVWGEMGESGPEISELDDWVLSGTRSSRGQRSLSMEIMRITTSFRPSR